MHEPIHGVGHPLIDAFRTGSSSSHATISLAPCAKGCTARTPGRRHAAWHCRRSSSGSCRRSRRLAPLVVGERGRVGCDVHEVGLRDPGSVRDRPGRSGCTAAMRSLVMWNASPITGRRPSGLSRSPRRSHGYGDGPERGAVARHDHRQPAAHPVDDRPAAVERHHRLVVRVRGADDGHQAAALAVLPGETFLGSDLVAQYSQNRFRGGVDSRTSIRPGRGQRCAVPELMNTNWSAR